MLKYNLNLNDTVEEIQTIEIFSYEMHDFNLNGNEEILVQCMPDEDINRAKYSIGDKVTFAIANTFENDLDNDGTFINDTQSLTANIYMIDEDGYFSIISPKYRTIEVNSVTEYVEDNISYLEFVFNEGHFFKRDDNIELNLIYDGMTNQPIQLDDVEYVNCKTLRWEIQNDAPYILNITNAIFNSSDSISNRLVVRRLQSIFRDDFNRDEYTQPNCYIVKPKIKIEIPIVQKSDVSLIQQNLLDNEFVEREVTKAIPSFLDMEKNVYSPVVMKTDGTYGNVSKINFNLHFRKHSGDNWTVNDSDGWNFSDNMKFSYKNKNNQSDLLCYAGFTNKDVKEQRNRLQKSFLRLSFYDSMNPSNQQLLSYSTIFFNTNSLYSKSMRCNRLNDWYISSDNRSYITDNISVNYELNIGNNKIPKKITNNDESIENYRLSSQISVTDKYSSYISSEGFYLYLWCDNKTNIPEHLYMKVDFNHAGYGRVIPMMMPFYIEDVDSQTQINSQNHIKTNDEIIDDWNNGGYGMKKFNEYSYIRLKYQYDAVNKRYIYYLDQDLYGNLIGPVLNINLYEARINFNVNE